MADDTRVIDANLANASSGTPMRDDQFLMLLAIITVASAAALFLGGWALGTFTARADLSHRLDHLGGTLSEVIGRMRALEERPVDGADFWK